jgi:predicted Fe-S protein YdhL (DUF1289 family)
MPRTSQLQTNFNAGELSPTLIGRTDFAPYNNGSLTLENFNPHPQGWMYRRKGTKFVAEVKDSTKKTRLIPFSFNISQNLIIELGAGYFRFFLNQSVVLNGGSTYELANSFIETDLFDIRFVQKDDVLYLTHPLRGVFKLIRLSNNNWTFNPVNFIQGPFVNENIVSTNLVAINNHGAIGTTGTITASGFAPFTANHVGSLWLVRDGTEYAYLKITAFTSSTSVNYISQSVITQQMTNKNIHTWSEGEFGLHRSFPRAITFHEQRLVFAGTLNATQKIWFSVSSDFENFKTGTVASDSFNRTIAAVSNDSILWLLSDESLFIGTAESIWRAKPSSNSAGLSNLDFGVKRQIAFGSANLPPVYADDSAFYLQRGNQKVRGISYSASRDKLIAEDISIKSNHITGNGLIQFAYQMNPVSTIFAIREDGVCVNCVYESAQEVLAWNKMSTDGKYEAIATIPSALTYDEVYFIVNRVINGVSKRYIEVLEPTFDYSNLGCFFVDCGLTYDGTQQTTLTISNNVATAGNSVFSVNDVGKEIHELNNGTGRAKITSYINATSININIIEPFSSNSLLVNNWSIAVKSIGGLTHLNGKTVSILGDGATNPDFVVNNGSVNLNSYSSIIHVGLKYISTRKSMPLEVNRLENLLGSSQGKIRRFDSVLIDFYNSRGGKLFDSKGKEMTINARSLVDNMNQAPNLVNENVKIDFTSDWDTACTITISQDEPQPLNVRSMTYYISINDY